MISAPSARDNLDVARPASNNDENGERCSRGVRFGRMVEAATLRYAECQVSTRKVDYAFSRHWDRET